MNFNEKFHSGIAQDISEALDKLIKVQEDVLSFLIEFLLATNSQSPKPHHSVFIHITKRIRFNLESASRLLPLLHEDYRHKTSINLIYRGIIDDLINAHYLMSVIGETEPDYQSLYNELNILHKEFLQSMREVVMCEKSSDVENFDKEVQQAHPELVDDNGKFKKNDEIRSTSSKDIKETFNGGKFISESQKLDFIKNKREGSPVPSRLKCLFKYFSQYQHYSSKMDDFLHHHAGYDIQCYGYVLRLIVDVMCRYLAFIELKDERVLREKLLTIIHQTAAT